VFPPRTAVGNLDLARTEHDADSVCSPIVNVTDRVVLRAREIEIADGGARRKHRGVSEAAARLIGGGLDNERRESPTARCRPARCARKISAVSAEACSPGSCSV